MNGATVKVYSLAKDGNKQITPHFKVREFRCYDGSDTIFVSQELVEILEKIRTHFGKAVNINSGYRTDYHNDRTKDAAKFSQHKYGTAADITVKGVAPKDVAEYAETILVGMGGIGIYKSFTHIDVRKTKSRWNG